MVIHIFATMAATARVIWMRMREVLIILAEMCHVVHFYMNGHTSCTDEQMHFVSIINITSP